MALGEQGVSEKGCLKWTLRHRCHLGTEGTLTNTTVCLGDKQAVLGGWLYWTGSGGDSSAAEEETWRSPAPALRLGRGPTGRAEKCAGGRPHRGVLPV